MYSVGTRTPLSTEIPRRRGSDEVQVANMGSEGGILRQVQEGIGRRADGKSQSCDGIVRVKVFQAQWRNQRSLTRTPMQCLNPNKPDEPRRN